MNILIDDKASDRLWKYVKSVSTEIGGLGYAWLEAGGTIAVTDVFLIPQTVSGGAVDFDAESIPFAIEKAAQDSVLGADGFIWFSWHSHNTMQAFWSATDEQCIKTYANAGIKTLLSLVGNHKREYKLRLDLFDVEHYGVTVPHVTMDNLKYTTPADVLIANDVSQFVKKHQPPKSKFGGGYTKHQPKKLGQPKKNQAPSGTLLTGKERDEFFRLGYSLQEALEIRELMDDGIPFEFAIRMVAGDDLDAEHPGVEALQVGDAVDDEDNGFVVGPTGLSYQEMGFDHMAWGDTA